MAGEIVRADEVDREGVSFMKARHLLATIFLGRTRGADAYLEKFTDFDIRSLRGRTGKRIRNVLLDVDGCIAPPYREILEENIVHVDHLIGVGVHLGVYSNCKGMERLRPLVERNIPIYSGAHPKPSKEGFLDACESMQFHPLETWMIGDNPTTDGGAVGVLEGMAFVRPVHVIPPGLSFKKRASMHGADLLRRTAIAATLLRNKKIIRCNQGVWYPPYR